MASRKIYFRVAKRGYCGVGFDLERVRRPRKGESGRAGLRREVSREVRVWDMGGGRAGWGGMQSRRGWSRWNKAMWPVSKFCVT